MAQPIESKTQSGDEAKKYDPPIETERVLDDSDKEMMKKIEEKFGDKLKPLYPFVIRTFITGYAHTKDRYNETCSRIEHYLERYETYKFETILDKELANEDKMLDAWKVFTYGYDHQGHPVMYDEIGSASIAAVEEAFNNDMDLLRQYRYRFHRRLANCKRIQSDRLNTMIYKHVFVMDLGGFSSSHFGKKYRKIIQEIIGDEQNVFPETLYVMFIVNAPWAFRLIWKIVSTFIDPITYQKIKVLGSDYIGELTKYVDINSIPPKYGGKGTIPIKLGRCSDLPHDRYPLSWTPDQTTVSAGNDDAKQDK